MKSKIMILGIAVVAIGLVALPQTLALLSGQHNFYDVLSNNVYNNTGNVNTAIPCAKCHADVYAEFNQPNENGTTNLLNQGHLTLQGCQGCHMTDGPNPNINGDPNATGTPNANVTFHAAAAPACISCHSGDAGDESMGALNATLIFNGKEEVHTAFANGANTSGLLKDANEACIACHTHVAVKISWSKAYMMTFNATETVNTSANSSHSWTVDTFNASGIFNVTTQGNQTGGTNSTSNSAYAYDNGTIVTNP